MSAAGAAHAAGGSIVVRLLTDPTPAGVAWSYSGVGPQFQLRASGTTKTISGLADGTYRLVEAGAAADQPKTLTSLTCADPSGDTVVNAASATATVALSSGETVTCTFTHRALGPRPAASAVQLAAKYAPVLRLASGEHYRPLRLEDYLSTTVLRSGSPPHGTLTQAQPTLFSLPVATAPTYLDIHGAEPQRAPRELRDHRAAAPGGETTPDRLLPPRVPTLEGTRRDRVLAPLSVQRLLRRA